jgi:hypothetical protein
MKVAVPPIVYSRAVCRQKQATAALPPRVGEGQRRRGAGEQRASGDTGVLGEEPHGAGEDGACADGAGAAVEGDVAVVGAGEEGAGGAQGQVHGGGAHVGAGLQPEGVLLAEGAAGREGARRHAHGALQVPTRGAGLEVLAARDDVHDTAERIGAVKGGALRPPDDLDPLDGLGRDLGQDEGVRHLDAVQVDLGGGRAEGAGPPQAAEA